MKSFVKKSMFQKVIAAALVMVIGLQLSTASAHAATANWNLRYVKYAPTTEQKSSWNARVSTTSATTEVKINQVGGGARIGVYTTNGIDAKFIGPGSVKVTKIKKGKVILVQVKYEYKGSSSNYPSGKLIY